MLKQRMAIPRKNFLPSLSMWTMVQMLPGKADTETRNELRKTLTSTFTFCEEKRSIIVKMATNGRFTTDLWLFAQIFH